MDRSRPSLRRPARRPLGLSAPALVGLALLAVPRVVLHDLDLITEGTFVNGLFVFVPPAVWVLVAVAKRVPNPFATVLVVGVIHGVFLVVVHQLLWETMDLPAAASTPFARAAAVVAGLLTGVLVGAVAGALAWGVDRLVAARRG
ncbi:hypothetical protein [Pseudonocardia humida]|uniref:Uncharacterized protein n=1 Tax=Pseudonocardia humida TaxID=2800819 RepID=A0ABT1A612_9PSEU|nr:hypothetical protein [Pseudonocardia humida]MCO1658421.1 hypothetical protein [Pseudonocardia humida]